MINALQQHQYRECIRCVYNELVDPDLYFNDEGLCNHCVDYNLKLQALNATQRPELLNKLMNDVKAAGKGKRYDCIIGVSGGCDSSYVAHLVKEFGLRPLAVHCDNGWNTELAVTNIHNVLQSLNIDLHTHVINWEEFKDLQLAYFKASVIDIEVPSDHAITALMYRTAAKHGIKYILSGENFITESQLPSSWVYLKNDLVNLKAIHKKFGARPLKTFPTLGYTRQLVYQKVNGIRSVNLLDFVSYNKSEAKALLANNYGWRDYEGKHFESIITRFYQAYILPKKFGVDKRYAHLASMICSGQLSKENALVELQQPPHDPAKMAEDKTFVLKKLGLTNDAFEQLMQSPIRQHTDYPSVLSVAERWRSVLNVYKKITGKPTTFQVMRPNSVAVLLDNPFEIDNRVHQQAATLAKRYDVTLYAINNGKLPVYEIKDGIKIRRVFLPDIHNWRRRDYVKLQSRLIARQGYAVIHANDHVMLDVACGVKSVVPDCKVVYDSHELFHAWPLNLLKASWSIRTKSLVVRKRQIMLEKQNAKCIDRLVTVNQSLADNLFAYFGLKREPVVLRNVPVIKQFNRGQHLLRRKFNIPDHQKILVYIGAHVYPRTLNIETVMQQLSLSNDFAFVLICEGDHNRKELEQYANANDYNNVYFHDLLKPHEIYDHLCDCDAGLVSTWNKKDLSYWYALDNKLFNYLMSEIPILATAQPEYKLIVENYNIGVCVNPENENAYINGLREILQNVDTLKQNLVKAKEELNWDVESQKLIELYNELLPTKAAQRVNATALVK